MQRPHVLIRPRIWNETLIQLTPYNEDLDDVAILLGAHVTRGRERIKRIGYGSYGPVMLNLFDAHSAPVSGLPAGIYGSLEVGRSVVDEVLPAAKTMRYIEGVLAVLGISQSVSEALLPPRKKIRYRSGAQA